MPWEARIKHTHTHCNLDDSLLTFIRHKKITRVHCFRVPRTEFQVEICAADRSTECHRVHVAFIHAW